MDCSEVKQYLSEYVDGCLPNELAAQLEAHLKDCAHCRAELAAYQSLRMQIRALKLENTDDFVWKGIEEKPSVLPLYKKTWMRCLGAAAACFVLVIGVLAGTQNGALKPTVEENVAKEEMASVPRMARTAEVPYADQTFDISESGATPFGHENVKQNGAAAEVYTTRVLTFSVREQAREAFLRTLSGLRMEGVDEPTIINASDLDKLLQIDGVEVIKERLEETSSAVRQGKIVIEYENRF